LDDKIYWLAWHIVLAGQARKFWTIMEHFGTPENAWRAPDQEFIGLAGSRPTNQVDMLERRRNCDLSKVASYLDKQENTVLFYTDAAYPEQLKNIYDPPPVLFLRGRVDCFNDLSVALVGSRKATPYGLSVTENLARELSGAGVVVVSGLARGIDAAAHRGTLDAGGKTIAVLGCGVDVAYPKENTRLMGSIVQNGLLISEFPPGTGPKAWHFPVRNRIISGLCKLIVVVEAAERSGALITAHMALEQGRDVMAVPGNITSKLSRGSNELIKQGAAPVLGAADIIEELGLTVIKPEPRKSAEGLKLDDNEKLLLKLLNFESVPLELIVQKSGLTAGEVMSALMFLEVKGLIRQMPGRLYALSGK
jgi:DNA processing protein